MIDWVKHEELGRGRQKLPSLWLELPSKVGSIRTSQNLIGIGKLNCVRKQQWVESLRWGNILDSVYPETHPLESRSWSGAT